MRTSVSPSGTRAACALSLVAVALAAGVAPGATGAQQPQPRAPASTGANQAALRQEIDALNQAMVAAFKRNPASVATFYTDDARIIGGGGRQQGRAQVDAYWAGATSFSDWSLETLDVGGDSLAPWLLGRSTLTGQGGRTMITNFLGVLRRMPDGTLMYQVDFYTAAPPGAARPPGEPAQSGVPQSRPPQSRLPQSRLPQSRGEQSRSPFDGPARTILASTTVNVPLTREGGFYFVDVQVNGRPLRFTLETGAGFFAISSNAARTLGLRVDTAEVMPGNRAAVAYVDSLVLPGVRFEGIAARVTTTFDGMGFDGIISIAVLKDLLATIDLGASRITLERGELPTANGRDVSAIVGRDRGRRVDFEMNLGGVVVPAVLDTRSFLSIIVPDSMESLLRFRDVPRFALNARGPSQGAFTLRGAHLAGDLRIGEFSIRNPGVLLRDRPGAVVGVPFMEQFAITIDQKSQRIRFARPGRGSVVVVPPESWEADSARGDTPAASAAGSSSSGPVRRAAGPAPAGRPMGFNMASPSAGVLVVVNLVPGSNAAKAGIRNDDRVVEFDGTPAASMSQDVFRAAIAKGVPIKVVVIRDGKRLEFSVMPQPGM